MNVWRRLRQVFCVHDWSCRWSRACRGDHYCLKCGKGSRP